MIRPTISKDEIVMVQFALDQIDHSIAWSNHVGSSIGNTVPLLSSYVTSSVTMVRNSVLYIRSTLDALSKAELFMHMVALQQCLLSCTIAVNMSAVEYYGGLLNKTITGVSVTAARTWYNTIIDTLHVAIHLVGVTSVYIQR